MKVFVFWLALTLLPAIALATAGPSLAANDCTSPGMRCVDPNIGCDPGSEQYDSSQQCPDNGTGTSLSCCVATGQQQQSCSSVGGTCKTSCANGETASGQRDCTWQQGLACCIPSPQTGGGSSPLCGTDNLGVQTAIGCLMAGSPKQLISQLLGWGVTVGGGIAFVMIVIAGFQMTTAGGDPKKVQAARELLMSAIGGLILIVLSVVLLNFIGVNILGLNNLGFNIP